MRCTEARISDVVVTNPAEEDSHVSLPFAGQFLGRAHPLIEQGVWDSRRCHV